MNDKVFAECKRICQRKAQNANRPHRVMRNDGEWISVVPQPKLTWLDVMSVMLDAFGHCCWCGIAVWLEGSLEHIKRIADGGTNDYENLAWACVPCNRKGYYRDP
jgi:5-methylcytosine-specific restriction endonuclease McrA